MFLFSANFGAMDRLADDKSNTFRKCRIIAFAAPCAVAVLYALFIFSTELPIMAQVVSAVTTLLAMRAICIVAIGYGICLVKKRPKLFRCGAFAHFSCNKQN